MKHYLSININNRKKQVLTLSNSKPSALPPFVIQREALETLTLFSLDSHTQLLARSGYEDDLYLDWSSMTIESSVNKIILTLKTTKVIPIKTESLLPQTEDFLIKFINNEYTFEIKSHAKTQLITVQIDIIIDENKTVEGSFLLHLAPKEQIFDVAMDFGSEASQVVTYQRSSPHHILTRLNLVEILLDYFYPTLKNTPLHQQTEDLELYRSAFFVKKEGSVFDLFSPPGINKEKEFLNLLTNRQEIDKLSLSHFLVSNLKLAHLGAYNFPIHFESPQTNAFAANQKDFIDTISKLQQAVINYILQTVLKKLRESNRENRPIYLVVKLLVPNVFDQPRASRLVNGTLLGLDKIAEQYPDYLLSGKEVSTLSESDASFLGFKRLKDKDTLQGGKSYFTTGKRYLTIDVGKGTTDFSILELNKKDFHLSSLYRSGFIGAGNVISYAFIDTIFAEIFGENTLERQQAIYNICLSTSAGLADKIRFTELIEVLKKNYKHKANESKYQNLQQLIPIELQDIRSEYQQNSKATGLLEQISKAIEVIIQKQGSLRDEFDIIQDTVNKMVNRIAKEVYQTGYYTNDWIDKIILTGRGFKFELLVEEIQKEFKKPTITADELKKICLLGAFSGENINFDSNLVGRPNIYQILGKVQQEAVKEIDLGINVPKLNIPIPDKLRNNISEIFKMVKFWDMTLEEGMKGDDPFAENTIQEIRTDKKREYSPEETFFLNGAYFDNFNPNVKTVSVCGLDYKNHKISNPNINICYTGDEFLIRGPQSANSLEVHPAFFQNDRLVFQTLFPFLECSNINEIAVKPLTDDF